MNIVGWFFIGAGICIVGLGFLPSGNPEYPAERLVSEAVSVTAGVILVLIGCTILGIHYGL